MSFKKDLRELLKPYYLVNIFLSLSYVIFKRLPGLCNYVFALEHCELDGRETEILFFLLIVVMIRTRKSGSVSMINYISSSFVYTKIANLILWFYADLIMGLIFGVIFVLSALLLPQPTYSGPDNVIYFHGVSGLEEELARDKRTVWLVAFYTAWNPSCVNFALTFSKLSNDFYLDNLKFGKMDIGRYSEASKKYRVSDSSFSHQLPTLILFKDGIETIRRPIIDSRGKVTKFIFSEENVKAAFELQNLYNNCKSTLKIKKPQHIKSD